LLGIFSACIGSMVAPFGRGFGCEPEERSNHRAG
jgi:hypothetical protein